MRVISDLHIHSRFAMACSEAITLQGIDETAQMKGITLIGTGDFTHPTWLSEIKDTLEESENKGLFKINGSNSSTRFILSSEVCTIYNFNNKVRKVHHVILMPSIGSAESLNETLSKYGTLASDGRPLLSMTAPDLVESIFKVEKDAFVFPAHVWTPYFGVFGAISGFNSMKEAYADQEKHIHALETGLSSDSPMNWRISALDKYTLLSNSDMHSLPKIGRSMNVFEMDEKELSYRSIIDAIKNKESKKLQKTIQFFPEEGKYHFDGHRQCLVSVDPDKDKITVCPVCGKKLVLGVLHRVNDLADRELGYVPKNSVPYMKLVPLREVISYALKKTDSSPYVERMYMSMVSKFGTEFNILAEADIAAIAGGSSEEIAKAIENIRAGKITIEPGYDGVFGKVDLLNREKANLQSSAWKQQRLL